MCFAFYTGIQDGHQNGKAIFEMLSVHSADTLLGNNFHQNRSILNCFQDKCVFAFHTEIQDGRQKWQERDFVKSHQ